MEVNKSNCGEQWMEKHRTKCSKHAHNLEKKIAVEVLGMKSTASDKTHPLTHINQLRKKPWVNLHISGLLIQKLVASIILNS